MNLQAKLGGFMRSFFLGFFLCLSACSIGYILWENHRYVPVLIQQVPVPVPVPMEQSNLPKLQPTPDPRFML